MLISLSCLVDACICPRGGQRMSCCWDFSLFSALFTTAAFLEAAEPVGLHVCVVCAVQRIVQIVIMLLCFSVILVLKSCYNKYMCFQHAARLLPACRARASASFLRVHGANEKKTPNTPKLPPATRPCSNSWAVHQLILSWGRGGRLLPRQPLCTKPSCWCWFSQVHLRKLGWLGSTCWVRAAAWGKPHVRGGGWNLLRSSSFLEQSLCSSCQCCVAAGLHTLPANTCVCCFARGHDAASSTVTAGPETRCSQWQAGSHCHGDQQRCWKMGVIEMRPGVKGLRETSSGCQLGE